MIKVCLCGELRGGGLDDSLNGKGAHRKPTAKNIITLINYCHIFKVVTSNNSYFKRVHDAGRDHLLLYELVPVILYKVPGKQVASKAITHSVDDQRQLLCRDEVPLQTSLQDPTQTMIKIRVQCINNRSRLQTA